MFEAAYYCEIMRAGIQSIRGQCGRATRSAWTTADMPDLLPQAFRNMLPVRSRDIIRSRTPRSCT